MVYSCIFAIFYIYLSDICITDVIWKILRFFPIYFDFLFQKYRSFHPWLAAALQRIAPKLSEWKSAKFSQGYREKVEFRLKFALNVTKWC